MRHIGYMLLGGFVLACLNVITSMMAAMNELAMKDSLAVWIAVMVATLVFFYAVGRTLAYLIGT